MNGAKINTKTIEQGKSYLHTLAGRVKNAGLGCGDEKVAKYLIFKSQSLHAHANNGISGDSKFFSKLIGTSHEYPKNMDAGQAFELVGKLDLMLEAGKIKVY